MSWSIGFDPNWNRDIGYGVPAICDHPECSTEINRGLSYLCGDLHGEKGCGLFFCSDHRIFNDEGHYPEMCERCCDGKDSFEPKPDTSEWIEHKLTDSSWTAWRFDNPEWVQKHINSNEVTA